MRIIAVDYGTRRIGLATGTSELRIAMPLCIVESAGDFEKDAKLIIDKSRELQGEIDMFVVGLPVNMDGSEGKQAELTRKFAHQLEKISGKKVVLQDERLSTFSAESKFVQSDKSDNSHSYKPKEGFDAVSAAVILERHFECH